jgi:GNAT superfamily N-acetyltransferase
VYGKDDILSDEQLRSMTKKMGKELGTADLAELAGATEGYEVYKIAVDPVGGDVSVHAKLRVGEAYNVDDPNRDSWTEPNNVVWLERHVEIGNNRIINANMLVDERHQGQGHGAKMLVTQTRAAVKHGFDSIHVRAAGRGTGNLSQPGEDIVGTPQASTVGYYTWARLGFTPDAAPLMQSGGKWPGSSVNLARMMSTKRGRDFWNRHGKSFDGTFDLKEGSVSRRVLDAYAKEKGL